MKKLLKRRGIVRVVTTEPIQGKARSAWTVCYKAQHSENSGRLLLKDVEETAKCQISVRRVLIYEEIPESRVRPRDFWAPLILCIAVLAVSSFCLILANHDALSNGLVVFLLQAAATGGFGFAGWLLSRALWGQRISPLGCTAVKQNLFTIVSLLIIAGALVYLALVDPEPWFLVLSKVIVWVADPLGAVANGLGWFWWPLLGLIVGFINGMAVWFTWESQQELEIRYPKLHRIARRLALKEVASWVFWRVNIADVSCTDDCPSQSLAATPQSRS